MICAALLLAAAGGVASAQPKHGATAPAPPPPPPPDPGPQTQAALDAQAQRLDKLEAALAAAQQQAAAAQQQEATLAKALDDETHARQAAEAAAAKAAADEKAHAVTPPPSVQSAWSHLGLTGFVQTDLAFRQSSEDQLNDSTRDPLNEDRFNLRRARLKLTADYGQISGAFELDANTNKGTQVRPDDVELTYTYRPWAAGTMGLFKIPFGYEVVQSDRDRLFLERSTAERALFPGEYDLGAKVSGAWRFLRYAVAAQNGEPIGEKGYALRDPNADKDITAHAGVDTKVGDVEISGGASLLTGTGLSPGTPATKDVLVWRDLNEDGVVNTGEIQVIAGSAAIPSHNFDRFAVGGDLEVTVPIHGLGNLAVYGEIVAAKNLDRAIQVADPVAAQRSLRELGFYAAATQELGKYAIAGVRFDRYDPDSDATSVQGGVVVPSNASYWTFAATGALRFQHARLILEVDHNRNHLGRDTAGRPVNLKDDAVTLRGELDF